VWAIGKHWQPEITESSLRDVIDASSEGHTSNEHASAARSGQAVSSWAAAAGQSASSRMHEEMPLLKAHGTKPTSARGSVGVLQESKKQESFKESLVNGQRNSAQSKAVGANEARGVSTHKAAHAANSNNV